jgi:pimeloyl-ACP methyl ester carboxylesterase
VLCLQGDEDEYGTRAQLEAIAEQVPETEIVMLPACGHSPHRDQFDAALEKMAEFVGRFAGPVK